MQSVQEYLINEGDIKYECKTCSQCFSDEIKLNVHYEKYHQNLLCWCGFQAETKPDIDVHKLRTHKCKTCTKCNFTAETYLKIFQHIKEEHKSDLPSEEIQYPTKENNSNESEFENSLVPMDTSDKKKSFSCDQCEHKASKKLHLKRHVYAEHSINKRHSNVTHETLLYQKKKYFCDHCE